MLAGSAGVAAKPGDLAVTSTNRRDRKAIAGFAALGVALLILFVSALASGFLRTFGYVEAVFALGTLGTGALLLAAVTYGGLLAQELVLAESGVSYRHGPWEKTIPWSDLRSVIVLGVTQTSSRYWAVVFNGDREKIVAASDFAREDLLRVVGVVHQRQRELGFEVVEAA